MGNMEEQPTKIKQEDFLITLQRGIQVIHCFKDRPHLTISETSKITKLSRPVCRRILLTLEELGYVNSEERKFSLTPKILSLAHSYFSSGMIWDLSMPHLEELSEILNESCAMAVLDGTDIVYVAHVSIKRILNDNVGVGTRLPAHLTSAGKVLLSYQSNQGLEYYFKHAKLEAITNKTIVSESEIRKELKQINKNGYAISQEQLQMGLISIAAPIRDITGKVVAAVNCPTTTTRNSKKDLYEKFLPVLLNITKKINDEIDFRIFQ